MTRLEDRVVPTYNDILVTSGADSGAGTLRWAYEKAIDIYDIDFENQARITIDSTVNDIYLASPLIEGTIGLTVLEIVTEYDEDVNIWGSDQEFRFMDHSGDNGVNVLFRHLRFQEFGAVAGGGDNGDGGTIRTVAPLWLEHCDFLTSIAEGNGGAIHTEYSLDITDCIFNANEAVGHGGAIYCAPEESAAGIYIEDCGFVFNDAGGSGGAIYFSTEAGLLGIYGHCLFNFNPAEVHGGAVYQYCGEIEIVLDAHDPEDPVGFFANSDGEEGGASTLYLLELDAAHIDATISGGSDPDGMAIFLNSTIPPVYNTYWADINVSKVVGGTAVINSNWPY